MKPLYDDRDLAALIVARGYMTAAQVQEAERAASDPSPGRLATTLLSRRLMDPAALEEVLGDLCKNQFRCRGCQAKFIALPRLEEKPVHCPSCGKWNLIPAASALEGSDSSPKTASGAAPRSPRVPTPAGRATPAPRSVPAPPRLDATTPYGAEEPLRASDPPPTKGLARALAASAGPKIDSGLQNPLIPGNRFGRYEIISEVARGAMGVVYRARHDDLKERVVALKVLLQDVADDHERIERFRREAQSLARIDHPNVVRVHDAGEADGHVYYTMELVLGETLEDAIKERPLPPREAAELMAQVARGVAHLHSRGVLHRDMKLTNVLLGPDRVPRITDFGLARIVDRKTRLTIEGDRLGTPLYMSPEQVRGETDLDASADIYGLGVMLFRLATRAYPLMAATPLELFAKVLAEPPTWPSEPVLDADFHLVIERALAKLPADRHPTALALAADLDALAAGKPIRLPPLGVRIRSTLRRHRRPLQLALLTLLVSAIVAGGALAFRARSRGGQASALAAIGRAKELLQRVGEATGSETRSSEVGPSLDGIEAALVRATVEVAAAGSEGKRVLGPSPAPGEPEDPARIALERALADLDLERWTIAAHVARARARALGATPWATGALDRASSVLAAVAAPPALALALVSDERRRSTEDERAELAAARAEVSVLRGDVETAVVSQKLAVDLATTPLLREPWTLALGIDQLLVSEPAAAAETLLGLEKIQKGRNPPGGLGDRTASFEAAVSFAALGRALGQAPPARSPALDALAPGAKATPVWRRTFDALVLLEKTRPDLVDPARADGARGSLDATRAELKVGTANQSLLDSSFARVVLGELELACGRPASAAEILFAALDRGDRPDPERAKAFAVMTHTPFATTLDDGLVVTGSLRAIAALRLAEARGRLLEDAAAIEASEGSVAAAGSAGLVASRAHLELARAGRIAGQLDLASAEDDRALMALGATAPAGRDPGEDRTARFAVAASRARTLVARGFAGSEPEREASLSRAAALLEEPGASLLASTAALSIARLQGADARAKKIFEGAAPGVQAHPTLAAARGTVDDPVIDALVSTSQAESAVAEAAAVEAARTAVPAPGKVPGDPRRHAARAVRAARIALDRDPASIAALEALARARLGLAQPGTGDAATALALARFAASAPLVDRNSLLRARVLTTRGLASALVSRSELELGSAAKDFDGAVLVMQASGLRLLERDDAIISIRRRGARALDLAHAPLLAFEQVRAAARFADEEKLLPLLRQVLNQEVVTRAKVLGVDATGESANAELAAKDARECESRITIVEKSIFDAQTSSTTLFQKFPPEVQAAVHGGFAITVADPHLYMARRSMRAAESMVPRLAIQDACLGIELEPELFRALIDNPKSDSLVPGLRGIIDNPNEDMLGGDLRTDPEILVATSYAMAAFYGPSFVKAREGIPIARRILTRRPEARIGHLLLGRLHLLAGDPLEAIAEIELMRALPRPFHEFPAQLLGSPASRYDEPLGPYLLAEAALARGDLVRARNLLEEAAQLKLRLPIWLGKQFSAIKPPPRGFNEVFINVR